MVAQNHFTHPVLVEEFILMKMPSATSAMRFVLTGMSKPECKRLVREVHCVVLARVDCGYYCL